MISCLAPPTFTSTPAGILCTTSWLKPTCSCSVSLPFIAARKPTPWISSVCE